MKRLLAVLACMMVAGMAWAAPKGELTFSASAFNPTNGGNVWNLTGEYLIPVAGNLLIGPSVSMFDAGPFDGGSFGVTGELGVGKTSGLFLGASVLKPTGDASDVVDYTGQARLGVKFGGTKGFVKVYASQTWSQQPDGAIIDPDGTAFNAGLGLRF